MKDLIEKMKQDADEYGDMHNETCPSIMEYPDECDCDVMKVMKSFTEEWMNKVNKYWIEMSEAHRPHCSPNGNKILTRMMGKKNRVIKVKEESKEEQTII